MKNLEYVFLLLALLAEIIGTVGGFGSSVFFVPVANFYFDFQTVLGMTALFHVASNLSKIAMFKKGIDKKLVTYIEFLLFSLSLLEASLLNISMNTYWKLF